MAIGMGDASLLRDREEMSRARVVFELEAVFPLQASARSGAA
jgi:hypothetical protein